MADAVIVALSAHPIPLTPDGPPCACIRPVETHDVPWWMPAPSMRDMPNAGDGIWEGLFPLDSRDPAPPHPVPVVYSLFDDDGLCYVGSTDDFRTRLRAHRKGGKVFTGWTAQAFRSRREAYTVERSLITRYRPRLNTTHVSEGDMEWRTVQRGRRGSTFCSLCKRLIATGSEYSLFLGFIACRPCTWEFSRSSTA